MARFKLSRALCHLHATPAPPWTSTRVDQPAPQTGRVVYVAEGEKDVETLRDIGLTPATTNPGGAGQWRDEHSTQLRDAGAEELIIFSDQDAQGRAHAQQVAASAMRAEGIARWD